MKATESELADAARRLEGAAPAGGAGAGRWAASGARWPSRRASRSRTAWSSTSRIGSTRRCGCSPSTPAGCPRRPTRPPTGCATNTASRSSGSSPTGCRWRRCCAPRAPTASWSRSRTGASAAASARWSRWPGVLGTLEAWVTGLRRDQSVTRADTPVVELDAGARRHRQAQPDHRLDRRRPAGLRRREHRVPVNPLHKKGYPSIGCAPCTRAIQPGEHPRAGRWWWENPENKECGLHPVKG